MHDANGKELKIGDTVTITCTIKSATLSEDYCNLTVETCRVMPPSSVDRTAITLNAKQVEKVEPKS